MAEEAQAMAASENSKTVKRHAATGAVATGLSAALLLPLTWRQDDKIEKLKEDNSAEWSENAQLRARLDGQVERLASLEASAKVLEKESASAMTTLALMGSRFDRIENTLDQILASLRK